LGKFQQPKPNLGKLKQLHSRLNRFRNILKLKTFDVLTSHNFYKHEIPNQPILLNVIENCILEKQQAEISILITSRFYLWLTFNSTAKEVECYASGM